MNGDDVNGDDVNGDDVNGDEVKGGDESQPNPSRWSSRLRDGRLGSAALSVLAGLAVCASFPPWGWWPLGLAGFALWGWLLVGRPNRSRFWRGVGVGLGWFVPSCVWFVTFTPPGFAIAVVVFAGLHGLTSMACPPRPTGVVLGLPAALVFQEWFRWHAPFGGVPLSVVSMGQAGGPLLPAARVGGPLLITWVAAVIGTAVVGLLGAADRPSRRTIAAACGLAVSVTVFGVWAPAGRATSTLRVALVQGGGPQGTLSAETSEADVFERHLEASRTVRGPVDLVVWPENVVNVEGPIEDHPWSTDLADEARRLHTVLEAGIVEGVDEDRFANAAVFWDADGRQVGRFDKVRRVPYGEYVPFRPLIESLGPGLLPPRDQIPGRKPDVVSTPAGRLGVVVSWEVFFGRRAREAVHHHADIILNPTNGSSYWLTIVQSQQVASSRLRAVETGRWVLQAAPTGFSAVVDPSGRVRQRTGVSEQRVLRATVERRSGNTITDLTGDLLPLLAALVCLSLGWRREPRPNRRRSRT